MTRQLPGFFIYAVVIAYIILSSEWKLLKKPHFYGAIILSFALILPWHIIMYVKYGMGFIKQYFGVTLLTAFKGYPEGYSSNPSLNPWYAYFQIILSNYEPWLIFMLIGLYRIVKDFKSYAEEYRKTVVFVLCWSFVPLVIFQAAKVKQYLYIMPLYVPFTIIAAGAFKGFGERTRAALTKGLVILVSALTLAYVFYPIIPKTLDSREYVDNMKLLPELNKQSGDIYILKHGSSYFENFMWFYADKRAVPRTEEEFADLVNSSEKHSFAVLKEDMPGVIKRTTKPLNVLKETQDSILFTN